MHVALDGGEEDFAGALAGRGGFVRFQVGLQVRHRFFHHPGALDHLGEEHLAGAKEVADDVHAVHEGAFDDLEGVGVLLAGLFGVRFDKVGDALYKGVLEALFDAFLAPGLVFFLGFALVLDGVGVGQQAFGGVRAAV